jgi:hypothetical protein
VAQQLSPADHRRVTSIKFLWQTAGREEEFVAEVDRQYAHFELHAVLLFYAPQPRYLLSSARPKRQSRQRTCTPADHQHHVFGRLTTETASRANTTMRSVCTQSIHRRRAQEAVARRVSRSPLHRAPQYAGSRWSIPLAAMAHPTNLGPHQTESRPRGSAQERSRLERMEKAFRLARRCSSGPRLWRMRCPGNATLAATCRADQHRCCGLHVAISSVHGAFERSTRAVLGWSHTSAEQPSSAQKNQVVTRETCIFPPTSSAPSLGYSGDEACTCMHDKSQVASQPPPRVSSKELCYASRSCSMLSPRPSGAPRTSRVHPSNSPRTSPSRSPSAADSP